MMAEEADNWTQISNCILLKKQTGVNISFKTTFESLLKTFSLIHFYC